MTFSDFAVATIATADTEGSVGDISVPGGAHIIQIVLSTRVGVGFCYKLRLDYSGCKTPKSFAFPQLFDTSGTEAQMFSMFSVPFKEVDITLPANANKVTVYAICDQTNTKVAVGLVWE